MLLNSQTVPLKYHHSHVPFNEGPTESKFPYNYNLQH